MKQNVNYIMHHKNVNEKLVELDVSSTHISLYNALFLIWNYSGFDTELSINRQDVMSLSKIGSANTYTKCLKELHDLEIINYKPSFNPLKGSIVNLYRFDKGSDNSCDKGTGKGSGTSTDNSIATLSKLLNKETIKLLNNNTELVNDNLKEWIESNKQDKNNDKTFSSEVSECYDSVVDLFPEKTQPETESNICKWKDEIRKIIEIDKYSVEDVKRLCKAARNDSFWSNNFLSIMKLRNKNKDGIKYIDVFNEKFKKRSNYGYSPQDSIWQG